MYSPWAKVGPNEMANFTNLMSEESVQSQKKKRNKDRKDISQQDTKYVSIQWEKALEEKGKLGNSSSANFFRDELNYVSRISGTDDELREEVELLSLSKDSDLSASNDNIVLFSDKLEQNDFYDWENVEGTELELESIPIFNNTEEDEIIAADHYEEFDTKNAHAIYNFTDAVTNQIKTSSRKSRKDKVQEHKKNTTKPKIRLNYSTRTIFDELVKANILKRVTGIISEGPDSLILHAESHPSYLPHEFVIKVFKSSLKEIARRDCYSNRGEQYKDYLTNYTGGTSTDVRAKKEMFILERLKQLNIPCPEVVLIKKHILVMSLIGDNGIAAPKLKFAQLQEVQVSEAYLQTIETIHAMYNKARLVHGNLSEYNILWYFGKCWFVDFSRSVASNHPLALKFLMRDCNHVITYFQKFGLPNMKTKETLFEYITSLSVDSYKASLPQRI